MIKSIAEICEAIADLDDRMRLLEMSQPNLSDIEEGIEELKGKLASLFQPEWLERQWDMVQQLQAEVRGWRQKHAEVLLVIDQFTKKVKLYEGGDLT